MEKVGLLESYVAGSDVRDYSFLLSLGGHTSSIAEVTSKDLLPGALAVF